MIVQAKKTDKKGYDAELQVQGSFGDALARTKPFAFFDKKKMQ